MERLDGLSRTERHEIKYADPEISKSLVKFQEMTGVPARLLVWQLKRERKKGRVTVESAEEYCRVLRA